MKGAFAPTVVAGVLAALLFGGAAARAEIIDVSTELSGLNSVPPNESAGTGMAEASFDTETRALSWSVTYEGLSGPVIAAHIHGPADPGANAGIILEFDPVELSPITGSAVLTEEQTANLLAGLYYVNLHTEQNPGGEIRGHLAPAP